MTYTIAAFYRFVSLPDPDALCRQFQAAFHQDELCGTLLIAAEGVNGTLAGSAATIECLLGMLVEKVGLDRNEVKFSSANHPPFGRLKFKVKDEVLAFRNAVVDPTQAGRHVPPAEWNALIADPNVLLLDTRNAYEAAIGTFQGAIDPKIDTFSEFAAFVQETLDPAVHRKVAMFCTGGIRCEKASAFMLQQGFAEVYHLQGGILKYLEEVSHQESTWQGECFVFDRRRAVGFKDFEGRGDED